MPSLEKKEFGPHAETLLELARTSIESGLQTGQALHVDPSEYAPPLRAERATFVTLRVGEALQGCVGTLEADRPLVTDVAENAFSAAFQDSRFKPLNSSQLPELDIHISVLSPLERLHVDSEASLIEQTRPKIDGLLLREGTHTGTFLPAVWKNLTDARVFVEELKRKAGLPADYWSETMEFYRYTTETIP
jgi:AmmeMemoRadiSam system protein A